MALRLLRLVNRTVKGTTYYKWRIGELPADIVERLGWDVGQELEAEVRSGELVLRPLREK